MGQWYTSGDWVVKPGREAAFQQAWEATAEWTRENITGSSWAMLGRDEADPTKYRSLGRWESLEAIAAWRNDEGFRQRNDALMEHVESFGSSTLEVVIEVG